MEQIRANNFAAFVLLSLLLHGVILGWRGSQRNVQRIDLNQPLSLQVAIAALPEVARVQVPPPPVPDPVVPVAAPAAKKAPAKQIQAKAAVPEVKREVADVAQLADSKAAAEAAEATALAASVKSRATYEQRLLQWLEQHKEYPIRARRRRLQGEGLVYVRISRDGRVLESDVRQSTGAVLLDQALMQMVKRASPFPEVPREMRGDSFEFLVPVSFKMK